MVKYVDIRLVSLLLSTALLVALLLPAPNAKAVSCSGSSCNGKDPISTGCNVNAYLAKRYQIKEIPNGIALWQTYADVYYSRTCGTNWVRVTNNQYGGATYKIISSLRSDGSELFTETEIDYGYGSSYSMMVYAPGSTKVQLYAKLFDTSNKSRAWTGIVTMQ